MESILNKEQYSTLNILKALLPIFKKYNLKYSVLGGTLLGAVRHQGFIPWDDDIDIGLPRPDYDRFLKIAENQLSEPLELQSAVKGNGHYGYIRVVDTETKLLRTAGVKDAIINTWVDVFPLDGVPNGYIGFVWKEMSTFALKLYVASDYSYMAARDGNGKKRNFLHRIIRSIFKQFNLEKLLSTKQCACFLNTVLRASKYNHCDRVSNFMGFWGEKKEEFPKEIYNNMVKYPFEDIELYGPKDYDFVLTQMYGDYMTPPPEKDRNHHKTSYIY